MRVNPRKNRTRNGTRLALTDRTVRTLKTPGRHGDGNGLYLQVDASGAKRWIQRVQVKGGRLRTLGLGGYPVISLAEAREQARANKAQARASIDPLREKRAQSMVIPTFAEAANRYIELNRPTWKSRKHANQWGSSLRAYAFPEIADRPVNEVSRSHVQALLERIWTAKPETARRVRQRIARVMAWCRSREYCDGENPASKDGLSLPDQRRTKSHLLALPYSEVGPALDLARHSTAWPVTRLAFEFLVLTATRSGEVRLATWLEIDWAAKTWAVPAERMKAAREHRVPLSSGALDVLLQAQALGQGEEPRYVFPNPQTGKPLSNMVWTNLLKRLEIAATPHGFRSSFRDWTAEQTDAPWAVAEAALAHSLRSATEAAYMRSDLFERRRELMEQWAGYLVGTAESAMLEALGGERNRPI